MSKYRVLEKNLITNEWIDRGWQEARGQEHAIRQEAGKRSGSFLAVPETSWHPVTIELVTQERLIVSDDGEAADQAVLDHRGKELEPADT